MSVTPQSRLTNKILQGSYFYTLIDFIASEIFKQFLFLFLSVDKELGHHESYHVLSVLCFIFIIFFVLTSPGRLIRSINMNMCTMFDVYFDLSE